MRFDHEYVKRGKSFDIFNHVLLLWINDTYFE